MKKLITIIILLLTLLVSGQEFEEYNSVNGQEFSNYYFDTIYNEPQDTIKIKLLIYSECHNGAICINGYRVYDVKMLGYDITLVESFYDHKWQPLSKSKIFNWINYNWIKRKRK